MGCNSDFIPRLDAEPRRIGFKRGPGTGRDLQLPKTTAEGVGFEPTVGFPTLDFESSALNRTQPPFPFEKKNVEQSTSNIQRPTQISRRHPVCEEAVLASGY